MRRRVRRPIFPTERCRLQPPPVNYPGPAPLPAPFPAPPPPASRRSHCRRLRARRWRRRLRQTRQSPRNRRQRPQRAGDNAANGQSTAAATGGYVATAGRHRRHRDADAKDRQRPRGVFRPRQDHRPHHLVRCGDRRNRAIRRAAGHRTGLLHASADRGDQYRCLYRSRRSDAAGRDQAHLYRLDVCFQSRPARCRASDLRCLADRLRVAIADAGRRAGRAADARCRPGRHPAHQAAASGGAPAPATSARRSRLPRRRSRSKADHAAARRARTTLPETGRSSGSAPKSPSPTSAASSSLW